MNWWLIVVAVIMTVIVLALVLYLVVLFSSEEDKNQAFMPKVIVVLGLSLACFNVLLLPYDVANKKDDTVANSVGGGVNTVLMWQIVLWTIAAFTFVITPFAIFYYEGYDFEQRSLWNQVRPALIYTSASLIISVVLLVVLWFAMGEASIPYHSYNGVYQSLAPRNAGVVYAGDSVERTLTLKVSITVYLVGLMSAIGWILFFIFAGVGLAALPIDFITQFRDRPKPISLQEYNSEKDRIGRQTEELIPLGKKLDEETRSKTKSSKKKILLFKQQVADLESRYEKLVTSYNEQGGSVLKSFLGLVVGIIGSVISVAWVLHIIIYNMANVSPFLNTLFIELDSAFSLLGTFAYGLFAFYLLWCVVIGVAKVGLNLLIFTVHPMKINGTLMNSFLFNTLLILLASVTTVQFCTVSFDQYASNTAANSMFTVYVLRLKYIGYIVKYLVYPLPAIAFLAFLWLIICPKRKASEDD